MKKLLFLSALFISTAVFAQTPRWGGGPPQNDNTGRVLTYNYISTAQTDSTATGDTVKIHPAAWDNLAQPSSTVHASIIYVQPVKSGNYTGDALEFYGIAGAGAPYIKFRSGIYANGAVFKYSTAADSSIALTPYKHYYVKFVWDGSYWLEVAKAIGQ